MGYKKKSLKFIVSLILTTVTTESGRLIYLRLNVIITARKGSLGQGNVFTPVCHSLHGEGGVNSMHHRSHDHWGFLAQMGSLSRGSLSRRCLCPEGSLSRGVSLSRVSLSRGSLPRRVSVQEGLCPGGSLPRRGSVQGGLYAGRSLPRGISVQGDPQTETPLYGNEWAVYILLEYILVSNIYVTASGRIR